MLVATPIIPRASDTLAKDVGLSVKDLAKRLKINRQFMAGFLAVLEERGEISCWEVGLARIYFNVNGEGK